MTAPAACRMADDGFRESQRRARYALQVAVVNRFVDELRAGGRVARVLFLSSSPRVFAAS